MAKNSNENSFISEEGEKSEFPWRLVVFAAGFVVFFVSFIINMTGDPYTTRETISAIGCGLGFGAIGFSFLLPKVNF